MSGIMRKVLLVMVACMVVAAPFTEAAIKCSDVVNKVVPCVNYLEKGGSVPSSCCSNIKSLNTNAKSTTDRRATCNCLKNASKNYPKIKPDNAANLPGKCGVSIPYKISQKTDCSKVN